MPVAYFLTARRTTAVYKAAIRKYKATFGDVRPTSVMGDFEESLRAAVREEWPATQLRGCWFHFAQAVLRKAVKLGLARGECAEGVQMAMTLPLLPRDKVQHGMRVVADVLGGDDAGKALSNYLVTQWSDKDISVFGTMSRTNNYAESFHRDLMRTFHSSHPNVWHFVDKLRLVNNDKSMDLRRLQRGTSTAAPKRKHETVKEHKIKCAQNLLQIDGNVSAFLSETRDIMGNVYARSVKHVDGPDGAAVVVFTDVQYLYPEDEDEVGVLPSDVDGTLVAAAAPDTARWVNKILLNEL